MTLYAAAALGGGTAAMPMIAGNGRQVVVPAVVLVDGAGATVGGASAVAPVEGVFVANGSTPPFTPALGRPIWVTLSGVFGGGTVTVEKSTNGTTWQGLTIGGDPHGVFTGKTLEPVSEEDDAGTTYRLTLTGAAGPAITYRLAHS